MPVVLTVLALLGELIEFLASVLGTKKLGGSTRGATLSVIGSMAGGLLGAVFGIPFPIPLVGMLIGSILFASVGAWIGGHDWRKMGWKTNETEPENRWGRIRWTFIWNHWQAGYWVCNDRNLDCGTIYSCAFSLVFAT